MGRQGKGRRGLMVAAAGMLAWLGAAPVLAAGGVCERIVVTGNAQYPPVLWVDPEDPKRLTGAAVELLEKVLDGSGIHVEALHVGPWSRAQEEVRSGRVDMLAGAFLTPTRLGDMDYVHPPYMEVPSVIFVKRGKAFPYGGWDDLRGKRGSSLVNNSFGDSFDTYAADHLDIRMVPSIQQSFELLVRERVDYVIYERHQGLALAAQLGIRDQLDIIEGSLITEALYFTVSHNSACNSPALRAALAQGMHRLAGQGEPRKLLEKYRVIWEGQFAPAPQPEAPTLE
ncbi:family 3 extracellular solute-binding protein [Pseudomonas saudimassiliensis]|uniref:Family 3 extracellular solute-binding protein n=2 Tax=Pseudomonas saudimassiliensis TaxID=1461581 RepID=A0A078MIV4_9PSED|nr:family 3 extracellular solute-binding protein [Pseudomonas saudimassiliensis]CEF27095.1 family 3 extracellular solute-binding protein [Pseudomonas saudimassiliensis]